MVKKIKTQKKRFSPFVLFIVVVIILAAYILFRIISLTNLLSVTDVSTRGFTEVGIGINVTDESGVLYFVDECYQLSMIIERSQAISIENGINRIIGYRPYTHDLIKDTLEGLDAKVLMVKITELKDNTFFAKLFLVKGNLILSLDSRPSDAIAIAARADYKVPIYVNENLLENVGEKIC